MALTDEQTALALVGMVTAPLGGASLNGLLGARLTRPTIATLATAAMLASFGCAILLLGTLAEQPAGASLMTPPWTWIEGHTIQVAVRLRLDALSCMMALVITGVGSLIHLFSWGYMRHEAGIGRYFCYLNLFCAAMLVLVLGDNLATLFVGWEGVGLCSYLLIGYYYAERDKAQAGRKAFVVNRIGDAGLLIAMFVLHKSTQTLNFAQLDVLAQNGSIGASTAFWAALMLALGVAGKSAQWPLFIWLPDAMAGPTPVSALIHAATMVTAGVYLMARMAHVFALVPDVQVFIAIVGAGTALFAATVALAQHDIKKVLAYSTVSQLGYMVMACGMGAPVLGLFHVVTHAFFKACLFLGAGAVIHALHDEQDIRRMGGLARAMPVTCGTFALASLALAGVPPLSGFFSKDAILAHAFEQSFMHGSMLGYALCGVGFLTAFLTALYMGRLGGMVFGPVPTGRSVPAPQGAHDPHWSMQLPLGILAALAVVGGGLNLPALCGGSEWLTGVLTPAVGAMPHAEAPRAVGVGLLGVGTVLSVGGLWLGWRTALRPTTERAPSLWHEAAYRGWGYDAGLGQLVVQPYRTLAGYAQRGVEQGLIEGSLNAVVGTVRGLGAGLQLFHSGNIQRYLAIFALGAALLLFGWLMPAHAACGAVAPCAPPCVAAPSGVGS